MSQARRTLPAGTVVRSHFRARWTGVVLGYCDGENGPLHCVLVRITHDRNGRPITKPNSARNVKVISPGWLTVIPPTG